MDPPFRIVGDGPLYDELVAMSGRLGLERTRFLGRLDPAQTAAVVSGSRFLVMPSECDENAPLAALEAMAAGRPIVVSERGGLPELASHGAGLVFTAGDADAMSERMRTLFADRERCQMLAEGAWRFAASELRPERHLRTLLAVYRGVLDASGDTAGADPFDGRGFADG
jgi:glycosyltransferase involved in cell wall biosynthesis